MNHEYERNTPFHRAPTSQNTDWGYLVVALLMLVQIVFWQAFRVITSQNILDSSELLYKLLMVFSSLLGWAMFVVMIVCVRRQSFQVVIGLVFVITLIFDIIRMVEAFVR